MRANIHKIRNPQSEIRNNSQVFPLFALATPPPVVTYSVSPQDGLTVSVAGMPIIRGSALQYYEPDWSKGYYTLQRGGSRIEKLANGDTALIFRSTDGKA